MLLQAMDVLAQMHSAGNRDDPLVQLEITEIRNALEFERTHEGGWKSLLAPSESTEYSSSILC
jgi:hypothetical protein